MTGASYWFYLEAHVWVTIKKGVALLYNSHDGKLYKTNQPMLVKLLAKLISPHHGGVIKISGEDLKSHGVLKGFIDEMVANFNGELVDSSLSKGKPFKTPPLVNIFRDRDSWKRDVRKTGGEEVKKYLVEVSLYLNAGAAPGMEVYKDAYRQFLFNRQGQRGLELDLSLVEMFFKEMRGTSLCRVNLLGGNIFAYSRLGDLLDILATMREQKAMFFLYTDLGVGNSERLKWIEASETGVDIWVVPPVDEEIFAQGYGLLEGYDIKRSFRFVIRGEEDLERCGLIVEKYRLGDISYYPYYTGDNMDFFREHVFIREGEMAESQPGVRELIARVKTNPVNFGKLVVLEDSGVYANVNEPVLGWLGKQSLYRMLEEEVKRGRSWFRSRQEVKPCCSCIYNVLCPPMSNYERILGRNNLCHIDKGE